MIPWTPPSPYRRREIIQGGVVTLPCGERRLKKPDVRADAATALANRPRVGRHRDVVGIAVDVEPDLSPAIGVEAQQIASVHTMVANIVKGHGRTGNQTHQLAGVGETKSLKSQGGESKGRHYRK